MRIRALTDVTFSHYYLFREKKKKKKEKKKGKRKRRKTLYSNDDAKHSRMREEYLAGTTLNDT